MHFCIMKLLYSDQSVGQNFQTILESHTVSVFLLIKYFADGSTAQKMRDSNNANYIMVLRNSMSDEEYSEYQKMVALANKTSVAASITTGAFESIPFLGKIRDGLNGYIAEAEGHTVEEVSKSEYANQNSMRQHPVGTVAGFVLGSIAVQEAIEGAVGEIFSKGGSEVAYESGSKTPSEIARSWQGTGKYPGIDDYVDVTVEKGTVLYRGEPNGTEYFTTLDAIEQSGRDATKLFEELQVEKNPIHGYRGEMQGYIFNEDVASAYGITNANPQFGKGGLPQYYVTDVQDLIDKGILTPVDNIKLLKLRT